jgi:hypothetical protein
MYQLILSDIVDLDRAENKDLQTRDVGEAILFGNLPMDYEVYALYYPGAMPNDELERQLRNLGNITGKNLFVNLGKLNDPNYKRIVSLFEIEDLPVIIVTANKKWASHRRFGAVYVRMDSKRLLNSSSQAIECLQSLMNLFIVGKISEAVSRYRDEERPALTAHLKDTIIEALKGVKDVNVSFAGVNFEVNFK